MSINQDTKILSPESINSFIFVSNFFTGATLIFGLLSVLVIFRYANRSMSEYKYFLLNITVTIFLSDMGFHFLCRPYLLYPVLGICMVGSLEVPLIEEVGVEIAMRAISFTQVFFTVLSMSAIANATIHRYALADKLVHPGAGLMHNKWFLAFVMVILQLVWPLIGCIVCLNMDLRTEVAIKENSAISEIIIQRSSTHACFITSRDLFTMFQSVKSTFVVAVNGATCALISMLLVLLCWKKITHAQSDTISRKTIQMQKQLMISLGIQAFTPNILFLLCLGVVVVTFLSGSEWTGTIGTLAFRIGSTHTTANFLIMCYTIPAFHRGIVRDFRKYVFRRKTTPTLLWGTTSSSRI